MLPDELDERLRHEARRRGVSIGDVARTALDAQVPRLSQGPLSFFSVGASNEDDVSERVDEFVRSAVTRRHRVED